MQWPHPSESGKFETKVEYREGELCRSQNAYQYANNTPNQGGQNKQLNDFVVVIKFLIFHELDNYFLLFFFSSFVSGSDSTSSSSKSIRIDGVSLSSYCPDRTDQIKAPKKMSATSKLTPISR